jgi:hypothetical protein
MSPRIRYVGFIPRLPRTYEPNSITDSSREALQADVR